jgi:hypothetical protein
MGSIPFKSPGKSGAFFIFTKDKKFLLKTATKQERDFLWQMLPYYLQVCLHFRRKNDVESEYC